jgi:hypothetical protein
MMMQEKEDFLIFLLLFYFKEKVSQECALAVTKVGFLEWKHRDLVRKRWILID